MQKTLNRILFGMAAGIVALDAGWLAIGHFAIDARNYALLAALMLPLAGAWYYYDRVRNEAALGALLACTIFLIVFPAGASLLSYLLMTVAGPRIDAQLAAVDGAFGFHWPQLMAFAARHPMLNRLLALAYISVLPQTVLLMLAMGWTKKSAELYAFSLALAAGAVITLAVWTCFPSFGAFSLYTLPDAVAAKLGLVLGFDYGHDLVEMLKHGPGFISPAELRGVVGFPSYHTVQALLLIRYGWTLPRLRPVVLPLNLAVLAATPIQGGHHLVDLAGGAVVAVVAIALADGSLARRGAATGRGPRVAREVRARAGDALKALDPAYMVRRVGA